MALSGMHIACGYAGGPGGLAQPLLGKVVWSQTMADPGVTDKAVPSDGGRGYPVLQFRASADSYASIGPSPDASGSGTRIFVPAGETVTVYAEAKDKAAWAAA